MPVAPTPASTTAFASPSLGGAVMKTLTSPDMLMTVAEFATTQNLGVTCQAIREGLRNVGSFRLTKAASVKFVESAAFRTRLVKKVPHFSRQLTAWSKPTFNSWSVSELVPDVLHTVRYVLFETTVNCRNSDWQLMVKPVLEGRKQLPCTEGLDPSRVMHYFTLSFGHFESVNSSLPMISIHPNHRIVVLDHPPADFFDFAADVVTLPHVWKLINPRIMSRLGPLPSLRALELDVGYEPEAITSLIASIPEYGNLERVSVESNNGQAISNLIVSFAALQKLRSVRIRSQAECNLAALLHCQGLQELTISHNVGSGMINLDFLREMSHLENLKLEAPSFKDTQIISGLVRLKSLCLSRSGVVDLRPLRHLINLEKVSVSRTRVVDLTPLVHLPALQFVYIKGSSVRRILPLLTAHNLTFIDANIAKLDDVADFLQQRPNSRMLVAGISVGKL